MKIQSISDIITNSSSEVFICTCTDTKNLVKEVQEFIDSLMEILGYEYDDFYTGANVTIAEKDGEIPGWGYYYNKGDLIIESKDDNSIPYCIQQILEELHYSPKFDKKITNVERHHLG